MTQAQWTDLVLKIGLIAGWLGLGRWIIVYSRLQPWWRDQIGTSLVVKSSLIALLYFILTIAAFIRLRGLWLEVLDWVTVAIICAVGPVMEWRTQVWRKESKRSSS